MYLPSIDIVVPANGEWRVPYLKKCLISLSRQEYPDNFYRITVVHTKREVDTGEDLGKIVALCQEFGAALVLLKQEDPAYNISKSYNYGARAGSSDAIACIDCDVYFHPKTLNYVARALSMGNAAVIPVTRSNHHPSSKIFDNIEESTKASESWSRIFGGVGWPRDANGNAVFPRKVYEEIHGYNEEYYGWGGADNEIVSRMALAIGCVDIIDLGCPRSIHMAHPDRPSKESDFTKRNRGILATFRGRMRNKKVWGGISVAADKAPCGDLGSFEDVGYILNQFDIKRVIYLGNSEAFLERVSPLCSKIGISLYSFDTGVLTSTTSAIDAFIMNINPFNLDGEFCIKSMISDEPICLICDGENRIDKLVKYVEFLPPGSIVSVLEWKSNLNTAALKNAKENLKLRFIKGKAWDGSNDGGVATWYIPDRGQGDVDYLGTSVSWRRGDNSTWHRDSVGGNFSMMGPAMLKMLKKMGLKPNQKLLDVGCGSLRLGVHAIGYLDQENYYAIDCDREMVNAGINKELAPAVKKQKRPRFTINKKFDLSEFEKVKFDFAWAQSLWTHLPPTGIELCLKNVMRSLKAGGIFMASYNLATDGVPSFGKPYPTMTYYPMDYFEVLAKKYGVTMENIGGWGIPQNKNNAQLLLSFTKK